MDDAAREYFQEVERRFVDRRGQALILSPADVARVADWQRQGVPLEAVLEAIDVHFERMARRGRAPRRAVTLAYLEDEVMDAWAGVRRRKLGRAAVGTPEAASQVLATRDEHARLLQSLRQAASALRERAEPEALAAACESAAEKLESKAPLFDETAESHDDERAEDHLRRLEKSLLQHVREALGEEAVAALAKQAAASLGEKSLRMDDQARERALHQLVDRSLRERLGVPRLSLFYA